GCGPPWESAAKGPGGTAAGRNFSGRSQARNADLRFEGAAYLVRPAGSLEENQLELKFRALLETSSQQVDCARVRRPRCCDRFDRSTGKRALPWVVSTWSRPGSIGI